MNNLTMARKLASYGRNGDSILVHMNPAELSGLAAMSGEKITRNPATGLPEAFSLWKLLAGIGLGLAAIPTGGISLLGGLGTLLGGTTGAAIAGGLSPMVGALGGALATSSLAPSQNNSLSKAQSDLKAANDAQAAKIKVPLTTLQSPLPLQPGYIPGISPEAQIAPARMPAGFVQPNGNYIPPPSPGYASGGSLMKQALMQRLLQRAAAAQQSPGGLLRGPGDGMSDSIPAQLPNGAPLRLSGGEYVVPADVVADMGNGSNDAGGRRMDAMVSQVRMQKHGTTKQPGRYKGGMAGGC